MQYPTEPSATAQSISLGGNVDPTVAAEGNRLLDRRAASRQELDKYLNAPPPEGVDLNTWNLRGQALARDVTKADADLTDFRLRNPNLVVGYKSGGTLTATTATNLIAVVPPDGNIRIYTLPPGEAIFVPSSTETPDAVLPDGRPNTDPNDAGSADNVGPVHSSSLPVVNPAPVAPAIPATTPETATPSTTPEVTPSPAPDAAPAPSPAPTPVVVSGPNTGAHSRTSVGSRSGPNTGAHSHRHVRSASAPGRGRSVTPAAGSAHADLAPAGVSWRTCCAAHGGSAGDTNPGRAHAEVSGARSRAGSLTRAGSPNHAAVTAHSIAAGHAHAEP